MSCTFTQPWSFLGAESPQGKGTKGVNAGRKRHSNANPELGPEALTKTIAEHWSREKQTPPPQRPASIPNQGQDAPRPRSAAKKFGKCRQLNFGALPALASTEAADTSTQNLLALEDTPQNTEVSTYKKAPDEIEKAQAQEKEAEEKIGTGADPAMCKKMPSKDTDLKRAWMMTIPNSFFGSADEWGRLRDAQVRFEPDRIIVEAHDRLGNSKIIHCSDIPRRLDTTSSTYKVNPEGTSVQITLQTFKTPRTSEVSNVDEMISSKIKDPKKSIKEKAQGKGSKLLVKPQGGGDSPAAYNDFL